MFLINTPLSSMQKFCDSHDDDNDVFMTECVPVMEHLMSIKVPKPIVICLFMQFSLTRLSTQLYYNDMQVSWNEDNALVTLDDETAPANTDLAALQNMLTWMVKQGWTPLHEQSSTPEAYETFNKVHFEALQKNPRKRLISVINYIDERVQPHIQDGVYVQLMKKLKDVFDLVWPVACLPI